MSRIEPPPHDRFRRNAVVVSLLAVGITTIVLGEQDPNWYFGTVALLVGVVGYRVSIYRWPWAERLVIHLEGKTFPVVDARGTDGGDASFVFLEEVVADRGVCLVMDQPEQVRSLLRMVRQDIGEDGPGARYFHALDHVEAHCAHCGAALQQPMLDEDDDVLAVSLESGYGTPTFKGRCPSCGGGEMALTCLEKAKR